MTNPAPRHPSSIDQLLRQGVVWQGRQAPRAPSTVLSSGYPRLDRLLGGWHPGNLIELRYTQEGCGELQLLLPLLAQLARQPRWIILLDPPHIPFAAAFSAAGVDLSRLLLVHSRSRGDAGWVMEQALKSGGCSAVLGWLPRADERLVRRLQLLASDHQGLGFLLRPGGGADGGSAAAYRLQLQPGPQATAITLLKRRHGWPLPAQPIPLPQHRLLRRGGPDLGAVRK